LLGNLGQDALRRVTDQLELYRLAVDQVLLEVLRNAPQGRRLVVFEPLQPLGADLLELEVRGHLLVAGGR